VGLGGGGEVACDTTGGALEMEAGILIYSS
jgi:hypothetical protein